jgi:hypothetical protein
MRIWIGIVLLSFAVGGCTEESRNQFFRSADNVLGKDYTVSYVDEGQVVKSWTIKDGKITSGEKEDGTPTGYYYFWSEETGYVQVPIDRTIVEELRDSKAVAAQ